MNYLRVHSGRLQTALPGSVRHDQSKNVVAELRRDASFIGNVVVAVVFLCFAGLAVAAAFLDLLALRQ